MYNFFWAHALHCFSGKPETATCHLWGRISRPGSLLDIKKLSIVSCSGEATSEKASCSLKLAGKVKPVCLFAKFLMPLFSPSVLLCALQMGNCLASDLAIRKHESISHLQRTTGHLQARHFDASTEADSCITRARHYRHLQLQFCIVGKQATYLGDLQHVTRTIVKLQALSVQHVIASRRCRKKSL